MKSISQRWGLFTVAVAAAIVLGAIGITTFTSTGGAGKNGTTLAAYKTIDICDAGNGTWLYSGEVAVWNEGAVNTRGLAIRDCVQNKVVGPKFTDRYCRDLVNPGGSVVILAGTTQQTATTFPYSASGAPLNGTIRNRAKVTITNHSGQPVGTPFGPEPKAAWTGGTPPLCDLPGGCVYTQGYWGNKPGVVWPTPYDRSATFDLSAQTWQQVLDTPVNVSQGYYQLAHQYIAALLNQAKGAPVPPGVQTTLGLATIWFGSNLPSACTSNGSCGPQKVWAKILDDYNNGIYPDGPAHCGD